MPRETDQQTAEETVRESLGLTADDLGMNRPEDSFDDPNDIELDNEPNVETRVGRRDRNEEADDDTSNDPLFQLEQPDVNLREQASPQSRLPQNAEVRSDNKGNLVNAAGQIVARAGSEARLYQKMQKATRDFSALQNQHQDQTQRLNKAVEIGTKLFDSLKEAQVRLENLTPTKYGLSDQEMIEAANFAKEAKTNPVGVLKTLLTRAAATGIDLSQIGLAGGNFDPKSLMDLVRAEIGTAMHPLKERSQRETQQEQQQREATERQEAAKTELNTFLSANPDAKPYLNVFHQVYSQPQFQNMSLGEVWARLQLNLMRKPQQRPAPQNRRPQRQPLPRGSGQPPRQTQNDIAPVEMSYEDIVRGLL